VLGLVPSTPLVELPQSVLELFSNYKASAVREEAMVLGVPTWASGTGASPLHPTW